MARFDRLMKSLEKEKNACCNYLYARYPVLLEFGSCSCVASDVDPHWNDKSRMHKHARGYSARVCKTKTWMKLLKNWYSSGGQSPGIPPGVV